MQNDEVLTVEFDQYTPRSYQLPVFRAMDKGYKRFVLCTHRRWGKDISGIELIKREAFKRVGTYAYLLPTYRQCKNIIWKGMTKSGESFLSLIPKEVIKAKHEQDMSIEFINGSRLMLLGSNNYDALRGVNPVGIVFSEFAYQHPSVYPTMSPVIVENDGWMLFQSTPFGENHFYDVYKAAEEDPDWFCLKQTIDDTGVITKEQVQKELDSNLISPDMVLQEYYCDFSRGALGSFYSSYVNDLYLKSQIEEVPWDSSYKVHTAWDIGMNDETVILFFQLVGQKINIIDMYHSANKGLEHYAHYIRSKPYVYGTHIAPHDMRHRDISVNGFSRLQIMERLGISMEVAPNTLVYDGIEVVRSQFNRLWIDEFKCGRLIRALKDYRKEYDDKLKRYKPKPLHDDNSHFADALRYLCIYLPFIQDSMTEQDAERLRRAALYNSSEEEHSVFSDKGRVIRRW